MKLNPKWDFHFLQMAELCARMSKDPSTKVGAVIVGPDQEVRSTGFNGFPRGIADTEARLNDRDVKLKLVVHAEMNAVLNAVRVGGGALKGCALYLAATDTSGSVWGGPPCSRCAVEVIQAGITTITSYPKKAVPSRWSEDLVLSESLLAEAGVAYREVTWVSPTVKSCGEFEVTRRESELRNTREGGIEK